MRFGSLLVACTWIAGCGEVVDPPAADADPNAPDAPPGSTDAPPSSADAAPPDAMPPFTDPMVNGSFEMDYAGWTLQETSGTPTNGTWGIVTDGQVLAAGAMVFDFCDNINTTPSCLGIAGQTGDAVDGSRAAIQLQMGAENHFARQTVTLPPSTQRLQWSMSYNNTQPFVAGTQSILVELRDPVTGGVLATPFAMSAASPNPIAMTPFDVSVAAQAGMTVELVVQVQANSGCLFAQFDHFRFTD
jgi:hypothetical protein